MLADLPWDNEDFRTCVGVVAYFFALFLVYLWMKWLDRPPRAVEPAEQVPELTMAEAWDELDAVLFSRGHDDVVLELPAGIREAFTPAGQPCPAFLDATHDWTWREGQDRMAEIGIIYGDCWACPCGATTTQHEPAALGKPTIYYGDPLTTPHNVPHALTELTPELVATLRSFHARRVQLGGDWTLDQEMDLQRYIVAGQHELDYDEIHDMNGLVRRVYAR